VEILRNVQRMMPKVLGNEGELMQVFLSIVVNALDAMEDRGTLSLETGTIPPIPALEKESSSLPPEKRFSSPPAENGSSSPPPLEKGGKGGFVFIKISDTGPGIPSQVINRIFDPFFTTKSEKGGTGLGLSIAGKIIKDHNGRIDVISKEREGTIFKITLPV
jgi:signal transduction histidine kinase